MNPLKVFAVTHDGIWPVGACSIVVAKDENAAFEILKERFTAAEIGRESCSFEEIKIEDGFYLNILDGDY